MEFLITFALCLLLALPFLMALQYIAKERNNSILRKLPPGPKPLPIIGNLLNLGHKPHKSLAKLAQIHGPLISLKLGQVKTIVISSSTLAREILQTHDQTFSNRYIIDAILAEAHHEAGLAWVPIGATWRNLRKICNSHIFSTQKLDSNQHLRRKKIQEFLVDVQKSGHVGEAICIGQAAFKATLNVMSNTVFSLDLTDTGSDTAREFQEVVRCVMDEVGKPNVADYFPFLSKIDPQGIRRRTAVNFGKILDLFDCVIDERLESRKAQGYVLANDMLDTLLTLREDNHELMDRNCIKHLLLDLFAAGTDTTSSTLEWAMAELFRKPTIMAKARAELEQVIGRGNLIEESDISRLPYLQSIIKETFRLHPAVPLLLPRKAKEEVHISGYIIPKDAQVLVNAWAIGRDPATWEDPCSFIPERFLGSDMDVKGTNFELIPFGAGRRICPGLPLALRMLHLMMGTLILFFDWKLAGEVTPENMDMEDRFGITLQKAQPLSAVPIPL